MKILYKFTKDKIEKAEVKKKDAEGKDVVEVVENKTPFSFAIIKNNRAMSDSAEIFYNVCYADAIRKKMLTRAQMIKYVKNDNGVLSEDEQKKLDELKSSLLKTQEEYTLLRFKKDVERTEEDKKRAEILRTELFDITRELQEYDSAHESLFNRTAENYAFARYITWYILNISAKINDKGEPVPLFPGKKFDDEERINEYDKVLEGDDKFMQEVIREFTYLITYWINGAATNDEEFSRILETVRKNG